MPEIQSDYMYGGTTDYGYQRDINEDFLAFEVLREDILLGVIADGAGSRQCGFRIQPAVIAATEVIDVVKRLYQNNPDFIEKYPVDSLIEAVQVANRTIGVFKVANEDLYSGFGVCLSCVLIIKNKVYFAHCGNTRIYLIRHSSKDNLAHITQLTNDHTVAQRMVSEGVLAAGDEYYAHPARYTYTSGLGIVPSPTIQTNAITLRFGDVLALTTDGIHYAMRPEAISDFILNSDNWKEAAKNLIDAAISLKMEDNMTAAVIYYFPPQT